MERKMEQLAKIGRNTWEFVTFSGDEIPRVRSECGRVFHSIFGGVLVAIAFYVGQAALRNLYKKPAPAADHAQLPLPELPELTVATEAPSASPAEEVPAEESTSWIVTRAKAIPFPFSASS